MVYFSKNLDNFAVILKGSSVKNLPKFSSNFNDCFLVNNIDRNVNQEDSEYNVIAPEIRGKNIAHFVNRLTTAPLLKEHYEELNIKNVQFSKIKLDHMLSNVKGYYESCNLTCHLLPEELLEYNKFFSEEYANKHPNTGVLAVVYAAHMLKPKTLWVIGLDFYQKDYLFRRPWQAPLENQQNKMKRTNMINHFVDVVEKNPDVSFKLITGATGIPKVENLEIISV